MDSRGLIQALRFQIPPAAVGPVCCFAFLQVADIATTYLFRALGQAETNPIVDYSMERLGTFAGLLAVKCIAIAIALVCGATARPRFLKFINGVYVLIVALNLATIVNALAHQPRPFVVLQRAAIAGSSPLTGNAIAGDRFPAINKD